MSITTNALRELHRIHRQITDLRNRLERGPKQLKAGETHQQRIERTYAEANKGLTKTRVLADDKQLQLRQREERIEDLQAKLNACGSNREYQALSERIAADEQANSVLSDEILEALERIDEQREQIQQLELERLKAEEELGKVQQRVEQQQEGLESELGRVTQELEAAEANLPSEIKDTYYRITHAHGEDAMAPIEGETCSGCYHMLSAQTMSELTLGKLVFCKSCGALLYLPEDTSPD